MAKEVDPKGLLPTYKPYQYLTWTANTKTYYVMAYKMFRDGSLIGYEYRIVEKAKDEKENNDFNEIIIRSEDDIYEKLRDEEAPVDNIEEYAKSLVSEDTKNRLYTLREFYWEDFAYDSVGDYVSKEKRIERFEDYPENIQEKALEVIDLAKKGKLDLFKFFDSVLGRLHIGDEVARKLVLLSIGSLFVENARSVHQMLRGESGRGKTHLVTRACELVPERFVCELPSVSPLSLFYKSRNKNSDLNDKWNIYIFDDIKYSEDIVALAKLMTDESIDKKVHSTVIEHEQKDLEIPGKSLCFFTRARDVPDAELNNRLMYNNPREDAEHERKVSDSILLEETDKDKHKNLILLARVVFEKLIEKPIKVVNPWIYYISNDENKYDYRGLEMIKGLVKAMTFYRQCQRRPVGTWNQILGTKEDAEDVLALWNKINILQRYKLSKKQVKLLKILPEYDPGLLEEWREEYNANPNDFDKNGEIPTRRALAKTLQVNREKLWAWIRKGTSGMASMEDLGLVRVEHADPNMEKSPLIFFLGDKIKRYQDNNGKTKLQVPGKLKIRKDKLEDKGKKGLINNIQLLGRPGEDERIDRKKLLKTMKKKHPEPLESPDDIIEFIEEAKREVRNNEDEYLKSDSIDLKDIMEDEDDGKGEAMEESEDETRDESQGDALDETRDEISNDKILRELGKLRRGGPVGVDSLARNLSKAPDGSDIPMITKKIKELIDAGLIVEEAPGMIKNKDKTKDETKDEDTSIDETRDDKVTVDDNDGSEMDPREKMKEELIYHLETYQRYYPDIIEKYDGVPISDIATIMQVDPNKVDELARELEQEGRVSIPENNRLILEENENNRKMG